MDSVEIREGWLPGSLGRVIGLHGTYYAAHWGFGAFFEAKVARELAEFIGRYDAAREGAHLRWFIVSDALRGRGAGHRLMDAAVDFCRRQRYPRIYLWTFAGLHAARHLYEQAGFALVEERRGSRWGTEVTEQRFELQLCG